MLRAGPIETGKILRGHDTVETVKVVCISCGAESKKKHSHRATDEEIADQCFVGWRIKGVRRSAKTLCPQCWAPRPYRPMRTAPKNGIVLTGLVTTAKGLKPARIKFNCFTASWTLDAVWNSLCIPRGWLPLKRRKKEVMK